MRKIAGILLLVLTALIPLAPAPPAAAAGTGAVVFAVGSTTATVDGRVLTMDVAPFIDPATGRAYVPLRFLARALGANITWDAGAKTVTFDLEENGGQGRDLALVLAIGDKTMTVTNRPGSRGIQAQFISKQQVTMDAAPAILRGRTMVPAFWVARSLGYTATWNPAAGSVTLTKAVTP